ncbi:STAS/SEC14 domain-containing protein [Loktanella sp. IMCC34160]|uniref:STAS/SEC14 domain-containing protein n=1 Tax=Loktanella sp. IMCC34160 TaxID=2510646 RepID=UPI00101DCE29|nr:STAS/SEC14 domain-containing protein [Loktanella sp. IMCC34160]RYG92046.1 STAS/SEC14 domain-containing protein [Loktanella sp. IMCC34160]
MTVSYKIHPNLHLVCVTYSGEVTPDQYLESFDRYLKDPDYAPDLRILMNMTTATGFDIDFKAMFQMVLHQIPHYANRPKGTRAAILAPDDLSFGIGRMYQSLTDGQLPSELAVFRTAEEAFDFLGLEPDDSLLSAPPTD